MTLAASYHVVAKISSGQRTEWPPPPERAEAIRRAGCLQPSAEWAPTPQVSEVLAAEGVSEELGYYLFGLVNYVFFSFGRQCRVALDVPAMLVTVDTEHLIRHRGARVVRDQCIDPDDLGRRVCRELGIDVDDDPLHAAVAHWRRDRGEWVGHVWPVANTIVGLMTIGGDEALAFLGKLSEEAFGNHDILLQGSLPLAEALLVE